MPKPPPGRGADGGDEQGSVCGSPRDPREHGRGEQELRPREHAESEREPPARVVCGRVRSNWSSATTIASARRA